MKKAYQRLKEEYRKIGLSGYLYFVIRWQLVSFNKLEELISKKGKILDFGCGSGILSNFLALTSNQRKVVGIDICQNKINQAKIVGQNIDNVIFTNQRIEEIEEKFDTIVMSDVLHHLPVEEQKEIIIKLRKKLTENGVLIIQDINKKSFPNYLVGWLIDVLFCGYKNIFYRSQEEIIAVLKDSGFKVKIYGEDKIAHIIFIAHLDYVG